jgi:hypothetical protein
VNLGTRAGALVALLGVGLINFGLFTFVARCRPGVPCPSPSLNEVAAYLGLVVLIIGVAMLVHSGWHGSAAGWMLAAAGTVPATWFVYELARQKLCPLLSDPAASRACLGAYGEMTAPVLSFGVAGLILVVGWVRSRTRAASDKLLSRQAPTDET